MAAEYPRAATFTITVEIDPDEHLNDFLSRWHQAFMQAKGDRPCTIEVSEPYPTPFIVPRQSVNEEPVDEGN